MKRIIALFVIFLIVLQPASVIAAREEQGADFDPDSITCEAAIMVEQNSGKVLFERNSRKKMYPASLTKVLTALLAIEELDLNDTITVGREINLKALDASGAGLVVGEKISVSDLLRALLIPSGNDAAYTVAVQVARKKANDPSMSIQQAVDYFAKMMTERAKELGAENSNFVNPHGYHDDNHYSTAYDMYLITKEAMKHEIFREIVSTQYYSIKNDENAESGDKKVEHSWVNRNLMLRKKGEYYYENATGVKTGYTSKAGNCLISSAEKDKLSVILVTMNFPTEKERWEGSISLLDYGLNNFQFHTVVKEGDIVSSVKVGKKFFKNTVNLDVLAEKGYEDLFNKKDIPEIMANIEWDSNLIDPRQEGQDETRLLGPIYEGQKVGRVVYMLNGDILAESNLIASETVMKLNIIDHVLLGGDYVLKHWYIVVIPLVVLVILFGTLRISKTRRKEHDMGFEKRRRY